MPGYPQTLKYHMWFWQVIFGISSQTIDESLFYQLDKALKSTVFLMSYLQASTMIEEIEALG